MGWYATLKAAISTGLGFFSGAGSIAGAVSDVAKVASKAEDLVHDKNERVAGEDHVTAEVNAERARAAENALQASTDHRDSDTDGRLRSGSF